jgi:hypothetical protein
MGGGGGGGGGVLNLDVSFSLLFFNLTLPYLALSYSVEKSTLPHPSTCTRGKPNAKSKMVKKSRIN